LLAVQGLTKRFGGFTAVNGVSFGVEKGEIVGLIGPNGSGKSTIFNMLSGTLAPNAGSIRFEGREIAGQPPYRIINLGIGRTFQIPRPFRRLSLLDNVVLAGFFGQYDLFLDATLAYPPPRIGEWDLARPLQEEPHRAVLLQPHVGV
jgi:branched-chain amino acid transport system ATP-binding protein